MTDPELENRLPVVGVISGVAKPAALTVRVAASTFGKILFFSLI